MKAITWSKSQVENTTRSYSGSPAAPTVSEETMKDRSEWATSLEIIKGRGLRRLWKSKRKKRKRDLPKSKKKRKKLK